MAFGRAPDYKIGALDKERDVRQPNIGAAWKNDDGSIRLRLDPFIHLTGGPDLVITLFPNEHSRDDSYSEGKSSRKTTRKKSSARRRGDVVSTGGGDTDHNPNDGQADFDDEIPF